MAGKKDLVPEISFSEKRSEIVIFRTSVEALGNPCLIRFLLNTEKGYLALQCCEERGKESFIVPDFSSSERQQFRIYSKSMSRIIWQRFGWKRGLTYRCLGKAYPEYHLAEFDLNQAEPLSDTE